MPAAWVTNLHVDHGQVRRGGVGEDSACGSCCPCRRWRPFWGDHSAATRVADGDPLGATLLAGAGVVLGRGQVGETTFQDMAGGGVRPLHGGRACLHGGDPRGAHELVVAPVLDRGGGHDGETKLTFT